MLHAFVQSLTSLRSQKDLVVPESLQDMPIVTTQSNNRKISGGKSGMSVAGMSVSSDKIRNSCGKARCPYLAPKGFQDPISGDEYAPNQVITTREGTINHPPEYATLDGVPVQPLDKCFAVFGSPAHAVKSIERGRNADQKKGMAGFIRGIADSARGAFIVRSFIVGNGSTAINEEQYHAIDSVVRMNGLSHISYDHAWRQNPWVLRFALASCGSIAEAKEAFKLGARHASVVLSPRMVQEFSGQTVDGAEIVQCPAEKDGNCNRCAEENGGLALCDAQADGKRIILFTQHGGHAWTRRRAAMVRNIAKACDVTITVVEASARFDHPFWSVDEAKFSTDAELQAAKEEKRRVFDSWRKQLIEDINNSSVTEATKRRYKRFMGVL
tara:strand:- start:51 stop:1202 length:1152 start_codon:yes stop_codon:yes gene_type:complete